MLMSQKNAGQSLRKRMADKTLRKQAKLEYISAQRSGHGARN